MTNPFTLTNDPGVDPSEHDKRQSKQAATLAGQYHPQMGELDRCGNCGAHLKDVPVQGVLCPHCGADLEDLAKRGVVWKD